MLLGRRRRRLRHLRGLSVNALVPNAVTVLGMCAGLTAIRFAFAQRWELAVGLIILAGIIDGLDGRIARVLKASSEFGAQLDSLSDFLCFGVAPAVVLYLWTLHVGGGAGWAVALLFLMAVIMAPLLEEALFRGVLLPALRRRLRFVPAALLVTVLFSLGTFLVSFWVVQQRSVPILE